MQNSGTEALLHNRKYHELGAPKKRSERRGRSRGAAVASDRKAQVRCLNGALQQICFFCFVFGLGPRGSGAKRPPRALRGPSRSFRGPPGGLRDLRQTKAQKPKGID